MKIKLDNLERIQKELNNFCSKKIKIGVDGEEVSKYATYLEYGKDEFNVSYPARPFFRTALVFDEGKKEVSNYIKSEVNKIIKKGKTSDNALNSIGLYCKGRVVLSIKKGSWVALKVSTIKKKGKSTPLIDTGKLINSITFEVID